MDLRSGWAAAWQGLGAAPDFDLFEKLLAAYREPHRHYHTVQHREECFGQFDASKSIAQRPAEVALALWFHDAIYDPRRSDNEARSAQWAVDVLTPVASDAAERVRWLVMATEHEAVPEGMDARILVDIDLSILGAPEERFDEYEAQVREEYAWVPVPHYRRERRNVLRAFVARPMIFSTTGFVARYEARVRRNLERALARL